MEIWSVVHAALTAILVWFQNTWQISIGKHVVSMAVKSSSLRVRSASHQQQQQQQQQQTSASNPTGRRDLKIVYGCGNNRVPLIETLAQVLERKPHFSTFYQYLVSSGQESVLNDMETPYTIFAPVNSAFNNDTEATMKNLLQPVFHLHLADLIDHHLVPNHVFCEDDFTHKQKFEMLNGEIARMNVQENGRVFVRSQVDYPWSPTKQMYIVKADQNAGNGVIHGTSRVFLPQFMFQTMAQVVSTENALTLFEQYLRITGRWETLEKEKEKFITLFAPHDEALRVALPQEVVQDIEELGKVMDRHILVSGVAPAARDLKSLSGTVEEEESSAPMIEPRFNLLAKNGVVHVIDTVIRH